MPLLYNFYYLHKTIEPFQIPDRHSTLIAAITSPNSQNRKNSRNICTSTRITNEFENPTISQTALQEKKLNKNSSYSNWAWNMEKNTAQVNNSPVEHHKNMIDMLFNMTSFRAVIFFCRHKNGIKKNPKSVTFTLQNKLSRQTK